jgi:hypothetical protein
MKKFLPFIGIVIIFMVFILGLVAASFVDPNQPTPSEGGFTVKNVNFLYEGLRVIDSYGDYDVSISVIEIKYSTSGLSMTSRYKYYIVATGLKNGDVSISPLE